MKKTTHKSKTEINPNNGVNMEDLLKQVQNGTNEILKLQTEKVIYGEKIKTSLIVFTNSIKLIIHNASYEDEEVVQIDAFCKSTIVDMKNCNNQAPWNFQPDNFDRKKITFITDWCKISRIFGLSSLVTNISNTLTKEEEAIPYYFDDKFIKIGNDEEVTYGDGQYTLLVTPLYYNKQLPIDKNVKISITEQLNKLGDERNDWHEDCPVLDIIDPDLNPNYLSPTDMQKFLDENKELVIINKKDDFDDEDGLNNYIKESILTKFPEELSLRSQYKWIPTEILINKDLKAKLLGPIHNLPMFKNKDLYSNIVTVFEAMLPGFQKLNLLKENDDTKLQVVIKAQKYEIKPGMAYSGKWHIEGKTENIVAGGVYYCNIDKGFPEDKLLFRNQTFPQPFYAKHINRISNYEIDIFDGTAVVFSNVLPHRFKQLTNTTNSTITRTFLNFFIIDPNNPIQCDDGKQEYWRLLKSMKLKNIIIGNILQFISILKYSPIEVAKEKRKLVREGMKTEKSGWGFIHYGNAGDLKFFDAFHKFDKPGMYDSLEK